MTRRSPRYLLAAIALLSGGVIPAPPARAGGVRIYPLGDSITYGSTYGVGRPAQLPPEVPFGGASANTPGGYRGPLDLLLDATGITHELVGAVVTNSSPVLDHRGQAHHDGHPGYRIDQDAAGLDGPAGAGGDAGGSWLTGLGARAPIFPDVTVVHLGTNDIGQRYDPATTFPTGDGRANLADATQRATFVADMTARLQGLVDKLETLRPGSRVVLSTIVPITVAPLDVTAAEYATAVAGLVTRERAAGVRIVLADAWAAFTVAGPAGRTVVPGLLGPDNVHPAPVGYAVMASVYRDAIAAVLALP
jgi:lysophospholipase L1-like esterase